MVKMRWFLILLILFFQVNIFAQNTSPDNSFCDKELELKINTVLKNDNKKGIVLIEKSLALVNEKCKVELYHALVDAYNIELLSDKVFDNLNKGLTLAKKTNFYKECSNFHFYYCDYYLEQNNVSQAEMHLDSASLYLRNYLDFSTADGYFSRKSNLFIQKNMVDSSISYINLAIKAAEKNKDSTSLNIYISNLGNIYQNQGNYNLAIDNFLKSLELKDPIKDLNNMPGTMLLLGQCYSELGQYKTAEEYLVKAKNICLKTKNTETLFYCYIFFTKFSLNNIVNFKQGSIYADSALYMAISSKSEEKIINAKKIKAYFLLESNYNTAEAEKLAKDVLKECEMLNKKPEISFITFFLGRFYYKYKRFLEAEKYLNYSLTVAKQVSNSRNIIRTYKMLSDIYEKKGDFKTALIYHQQFYILQDSLENGKLKSNLAEFEKKYNIGKKEAEIANLNNEKELKNADLKQAHTKQSFFIVISILLIGFLFIGLWAYRKLRNSKNVLSQKNTELDNLNQVKNRLFSIIAHDVKGLAIPFQRASRILNHHIQKQNLAKTLEIAKELETNAESLSNLLDNLLQWSLEQMNGYTPKPEILVLKNEMAQIMETYEGHANYKNTILSVNISDTLTLETDKGAFHVIFRNLIANAIKYTENGTIKINAQKEMENIICTVKDSGNGMSANIIEKLFTIENKKIKNGTAGEKGSGLGLVLVKKFLDLNGGTIAVDSIEGEGTNFIITFPYKIAS